MSLEAKKNSGTDQKKNDGTSEQVGSTTRSCYIMIVNNSGTTITNVTLTHNQGDNNTTITMPSMSNNDTSPPKQINYETGWWANFDYWNISFNIDSNAYATPNNDRCNITDSDANQTIQCVINTDGPFGGAYNLETKMPKSSSCNFRISKIE